MSAEATLCSREQRHVLSDLLSGYGMRVAMVERDGVIPGSYWGESEAGLIGSTLYLRKDTPLHSALHEACHYICMDETRRASLHTDAGGEYAEEDAVCYLQGLLADRLPDYDRLRLFDDMDRWGYTFRLGAARTWFEQDADDARTWLITHRIIDNAGRPTGQLRR